MPARDEEDLDYPHDRVVGSVVCPCGAKRREPCLTKHGHERTPHNARIRAYARLETKWLAP